MKRENLSRVIFIVAALAFIILPLTMANKGCDQIKNGPPIWVDTNTGSSGGGGVVTNTWTAQIVTGAVGSPSARDLQTMVWNGSQMIMFGGYDGAYKNDLWWYTPGSNTWTSRIAQGVATSPATRREHAMIWDGTRAILFGGFNGATYYNDLWWYLPGTNTWAQQIAQGAGGSPAARRGHSMVWNGSQIIMFGGFDGATYYNDLWWYNPGLNIWNSLLAQGAAGSPAGRYGSAAVWDGTELIMFGGLSGTNVTNDLWWYNPNSNTWTSRIAPGVVGSPPGRCLHSMVWNGTRVIMTGGWDNVATYYNDLWWYSPGTNTWTRQITQGSLNVPTARWGQSMTWDGIRAIMFAGYNGAFLNDLWWYQP